VRKPVRLRRLAAEDVDAAVDHYLKEAGLGVAGRFIDTVERAVTHVSRHPHNGSLRFSYDLDIPELRSWPVGRFPYLVFYIESESHIDVWRVLHTRRDVAAALADDTEE
jgi:toxin ParE1/3/4